MQLLAIAPLANVRADSKQIIRATMSTQLVLPQLDDPASELTVERYCASVGAMVQPGQLVAVVVSAHYEWELPTPFGGTVTKILVPPGATVGAGTPLLELQAVASNPGNDAKQPAAPRATPVAQRMARTHGIDLAAITGTGCGGRVTRRDVLKLVEATGALYGQAATGEKAAQAAATPPPVVPRKSEPTGAVDEEAAASAIDRLTSEQQLFKLPADLHHPPDSPLSVPLALTAVEVDLSAVLAYTQSHAARFAKRGLRLDPLACLAYTCVAALADHRALHSAWTDDGVVLWSRIQLWVEQQHRDCHACLISDAAALSLQGLARALNTTAAPPSEARPTFVIRSAGGRWGAADGQDYQCPQLLVGPVEQRPYVVEQGERDLVVARPLALLMLSYDARIVSHVTADAFLAAVKRRLEQFTALC